MNLKFSGIENTKAIPAKPANVFQKEKAVAVPRQPTLKPKESRKEPEEPDVLLKGLSKISIKGQKRDLEEETDIDRVKRFV